METNDLYYELWDDDPKEHRFILKVKILNDALQSWNIVKVHIFTLLDSFQKIVALRLFDHPLKPHTYDVNWEGGAFFIMHVLFDEFLVNYNAVAYAHPDYLFTVLVLDLNLLLGVHERSLKLEVTNERLEILEQN